MAIGSARLSPSSRGSVAVSSVHASAPSSESAAWTLGAAGPGEPVAPLPSRPERSGPDRGQVAAQLGAGATSWTKWRRAVFWRAAAVCPSIDRCVPVKGRRESTNGYVSVAASAAGAAWAQALASASAESRRGGRRLRSKTTITVWVVYAPYWGLDALARRVRPPNERRAAHSARALATACAHEGGARIARWEQLAAPH
eukprot:scaffold211891_cov24-Tisochrysis_lutea.AAC.2